MRSVLIVLLLGLGCGGSKPTVIDPASQPPLPPSSGTPIGILLDDATRLHLRDDQLTALREIDSGLAARNEKLDSETRPVEHVSHDPTTTSNQPMRRRGAGHRSRGGKQTQPPPTGPDQATQARVQEERVANTKDALARAFALLDPAQRADAQKLLAEHGVDLATGGNTSPTQEPAEGDDGSGVAEP